MSYWLLRIGRLFILGTICSLAAISCSGERQIPDNSFTYEIKHPAYPPGEGPTVLVDETHGNFHTILGRYKPFADLLKQDGYVVRKATSFDCEMFKDCDVFVSSVPTSEGNQSAYSDEEIHLLKGWVQDGGGSLLLITDHMPDPPAIATLAKEFGITVHNGYVLNDDPSESVGPVFFRRHDGTLADHPITNGRDGFDERIDSVTSFTGCAIQAGDRTAPPMINARTGEEVSSYFVPLMTFGPRKTLWLTEKVGEFPDDTPQIDVTGWYQGGVITYGLGRIAFFGEAGMFTAQIITGPDIKFGMNDPTAKDNAQFLLNTIHWLTRVI